MAVSPMASIAIADHLQFLNFSEHILVGAINDVNHPHRDPVVVNHKILPDSTWPFLFDIRAIQCVRLSAAI